jgi:hypothetical protein
MTGFSLKLLEAASGLSTMSEISAALSGLIKFAVVLCVLLTC